MAPGEGCSEGGLGGTRVSILWSPKDKDDGGTWSDQLQSDKELINISINLLTV